MFACDSLHVNEQEYRSSWSFLDLELHAVEGHLMWVLRINVNPCQEQQMLLTSEPISLDPDLVLYSQFF